MREIVKKFETGGFPIEKGLFIQTDGELYGSLGDKKSIPYQAFPILGEIRKAAEKSLLKQNGNVTVKHNKEKEENIKRIKEDLKIFPSLQEIHEGIKRMNGKENSEK